MTASSVPLLQRIWLSWLLAFRVLFDGRFAFGARALLAGPSDAEAEQPKAAGAEALPVAPPVPTPVNPDPKQTNNGALQLLSLLQREGRFVDFVQQDIAAFSDADIGAAARVVHDGCQRALQGHAKVSSVRSEPEGAQITLPAADDSVKLVGKLAGDAPFHGVLRHRGWRVVDLALPRVVGTPDLSVVAPAEVEL